MKTIKQLYIKRKNARINVALLQENDIFVFCIHTRKLIDFKSREINVVQELYTPETFYLIADLMYKITTDNTVRLLLLDFLSEFQKKEFNLSIYENPEIYK